MVEDLLVTCPYCWQTVELNLDLSAGSQIYTEDCPVCCQPMTVHLKVDGIAFSVDVEAENG